MAGHTACCKRAYLGIDTSYYTTSVALVDDAGRLLVDEAGRLLADGRRPLSVPAGEHDQEGREWSDGSTDH